MGLREEARGQRLRSSASTCRVALLAEGRAVRLDESKPVDLPDRADWLDAVNDRDVVGSDLSRALAKRNIDLDQDTIQRHRRRECRCSGDLRGPVNDAA